MIYKGNKKQTANWIPVLTALACYAVCICFGAMKYQTNDDTAIQNTLAGVITGSPFPAHQFINILISYPLSKMYKFFPGVQWWFVYSHFLMLAGLILINYCFWYQAKKNDYPMFFACCLIVLTDIVFFCYPISYIAFTIVAGTAGAGALSLLLMSEKGKTGVVMKIAAGVLFVLAVCHRGDSGKVAACFLLLTMLYRFLTDCHANHTESGIGGIDTNLSKSRRVTALAAASVLLVGGTYLLIQGNRTIQHKINGVEFVRFNSARSAYMDYPMDSYQDNPQIYHDVGWDETTYRLVKSWCFMDEEVTAEHFRYLVGHSNTERKTVDLKTLWTRWRKLQGGEKTVCLELLWLITGIAALIAVIRKDRSTFLIWFLNTAGTMVLILYQLYSGRILYRTIIICLLPSYIIYMTIFIKWISKQKKTMYILSIIMILFCIPLAGRSITLAFDAGEKEEVLNDEIIDNTLKQYVIGHADNVYIKQTGMTSNRSPNGVLSNGKASNIIGWGGSGSYSKVNRIQLRANGIKNFTGSVFKNNNTFFVSATNIVGKNNKGKKVKETNKLVLIFTWLKQKYGARGIVQEDTVCDGIYVYRFLFETPEKDEDVYDYMNGRFVLIN